MVIEKKKILAVSFCFVIIFFIAPMLKFPLGNVKAADYGISNPLLGNDGVITWDCIYFGNYYQSNSTTKEPIKWRVLSVKGDDAFLLADRNMDYQPYNTESKNVTWETCTLRKWLNNNFYNAAFSATEKSAVKTTVVVNEDNLEHRTEGGNNTNDKVYLLSAQEAMTLSYGFPPYNMSEKAREAKNTKYINEQGVNKGYGEWVGNGYWWLRTPGNQKNTAAVVNFSGYIVMDGDYVYSESPYVRPVLHLNLSSGRWSKAGTVSSDGKEVVIPFKPPNQTVNPNQTLKPNQTVKPSAAPQKIKAPARVKKLKVKNKKKKSVTLSWKKVVGAKGYRLQYATNKNFEKKKNKFVKKTKYTVKKLKRKKKYYFRVRAYKLDGKKKVYGKWSGVKKVKIK